MGATVGVMMFAGSALKAYGAYQSGQAESQAADFNRSISLQNAQITREQTEADVISLRKKQYRELGAIRAAVGASGVTMDGSALDVLEASVAEAALDVQRVKYQGELRARGYMNDATLYEQEGKAARQRAKYAAASDLLMGAANFAYAGGFGGGTTTNTGTPVRMT